ncbi:MAG: HEPN domain-containing protein [Candidatus Diapherotrites archaeon]
MEEDGFLKIALKDLEAADILYKNKLYPQALYFLHQSLEKVHKAALINFGWIEDGHEIGHNLNLSLATVSKIDASKKIDKVAEHLTEDEKNRIERNLVTIEEFMTPEDVRKLHEAVFRWKLFQKVKLEKTDLKYMKKVLSRLEKEFKIKERHRKIFLNFLEKYEKAIAKKDINSKSFNKLQDSLFKEIKKYFFFHAGYQFYVIYLLVPLLPSSASLRYPNNNPLDTYNESSPVIKVFGELSKHIRAAIDCFSIFFDFVSSFSRFRKDYEKKAALMASRETPRPAKENREK